MKTILRRDANGLFVLREIQKRKNTQSVIVVLHTAEHMSEIIEYQKIKGIQRRGV